MHPRIALATLALASTALAQTRTPVPTRPDPTGTVSGHVFCSDTNQPARFAKVSLEAIPDAPKAAKPGTGSVPKSAAPSRPSNIVETNLDGSFTLANVKPGNYYVVVEKDGYINPRAMFTQKEIDDPSPLLHDLIARALPRVHVDINQTERAEVRLERGAALSGTILYDDGSPAAALRVQLLHKDANGKWVPPANSDGPHLGNNSDDTTDDRGHFRITSLLPDEYMVKAEMSLADTKTTVVDNNSGNQMFFAMSKIRFALPFYGTGTAHQSEASTVKLRAGQELPGQDMTIPIAKLHKLTGRVAAGRDAHFVNAAKVTLVTRDDNTELATAEISREDGLFHFEYVPDGDYILKVTDARDVVWEKPAPTANDPFPIKDDVERVLTAYGNTEEPIILRGDQLDTLATVSPNTVPSKPSNPSSTKPNAGMQLSTSPDAPTGTNPPTPSTSPQASPQLTPQSAPQSNPTVASLR